MRFRVRFHRWMTYVIRTLSTRHPDTCLSCPISWSTTPGVICTSSTHHPQTHVVCTSSAHHLHTHVIRMPSACHPHTSLSCPISCSTIIDVTVVPDVVPDVALLKTYCLHIIPGSLRCPYGPQLCFLSQKY